MPFVLFHNYFPDVAELETQTITVFDESSFDLPAAQYALVEMFCDEPDCDCRRVLFYVVSSRKPGVLAIIGYGWEEPAFYAKWLHCDDPAMLSELRGPALNRGSPQSELAPALLRLFEKMILPDTAYLKRVQGHYTMFREKIDKKTTRSGAAKTRNKRRRA